MEQQIDVAEIRQQLQHQIFKKASKTEVNPYSKAVFENLAKCHTAAAGMHWYRCESVDCQHNSYQYYSCGNRHCPSCGGMKRDQWLEDKMAELLPTNYFHCVFTLPHELNGLIMGNRKELFKLLFKASSQTILTLAKDKKWLGATPGIIAILHTWGQDLSFHPHVHLIVSGGGTVIDENGAIKWVNGHGSATLTKQYLFPKAIMQKMYKAIFLKKIRAMVASDELKIVDKESTLKMLHEIGFMRWNVFAKKPFGGPAQVLEYLGRYTHKVAITAHRILSIDTDKQAITFKYKDYHKRGTKDQEQVMTLPIDEFIRRFEQHILPRFFMKIRSYGYLQNYGRTKRIAEIFAALDLGKPMPKIQVPIKQRILEKYQKDISLCPACGKAKMELLATYRHNILVQIHEPKAIEVKNKASPK